MIIKVLIMSLILSILNKNNSIFMKVKILYNSLKILGDKGGT